MVFDFAEFKAQARQAVHDMFKLAALYTPPGSTDSYEITVRYHNKAQVQNGDIRNQGFVQFLENIDSLVFNQPELAALALTVPGLTLEQNGVVRLLKYGMSYNLEMLVPSDGPIEIKWRVTAAT